MGIQSKQILTVSELLEMPLELPDYQRPYKWQDEHVNQLFDDILHHSGVGQLRLGTVVLYVEPGAHKSEIVDGQQRLLTLTLLCHALYQEIKFEKLPVNLSLLSAEFKTPISIDNLAHNAALLQGRVRRLEKDDQKKLLGFLLAQCELICISLDNLSEAFQFFDSQNARGKALAPYDLLKAYHLREFTESEKRFEAACVDAWETAATSEENNKPSKLQRVMSEHLFRLRQWTKRRSGMQFTNHDIDVFKGINLSKSNFPLADGFRAANYAVDLFNADPARQWDLNKQTFPFQLDQVMVNGRRFFEYTEYYIDLYNRLFELPDPQLKPLLHELSSYAGCNRVGDSYVRNLFECAVMLYADKFGGHQLEQAAWLCFNWSYRIRLTQHTVQRKTVDNAGSSQGKFNDGLIQVIGNALHPREVLAFVVPQLRSSDLNGNKKQVQGLIDVFKKKRYLVDDK